MTAHRRLFVMLVAASCAVVLAGPRSAEAVSIATGDIIVADPGAGKILKIDPLSGAQSSLTAKIANAVTTRSSVFAIWITVGTFEVQGGDGLGSDTTISPGALLEDPVDITHARSHRSFYIIDRSKAVPLETKVDTGVETVLPGSPFLTAPSGAAFSETDRRLFVVDTVGPVFRYDPLTGVNSVVASGGNLISPSDIDVSPEGTLFVLDTGAAALIEIDPDTSVQTVRASPVPWTRLAIEAGGTTAIVIDPTVPALLRVDLTTGAATPLASGGLLSAPADLTIAPPPEPTIPALGWGGRLMLLMMLGAAAGLVTASVRNPA